jgi:zinc transporter ZupT
LHRSTCTPRGVVISRGERALAAHPGLLGVAAASMLYVSVADLIPGLHRARGVPVMTQQAPLIGAGIATIWVVGSFASSVANP